MTSLPHSPAPRLDDDDADFLGVPSMAAAVARALGIDHPALVPLTDSTGTPASPDSAPSADASESGTPLEFIPCHPEKYAILQEIGRGGMSRVYATKDHDLGRIVAMKMLDEGLDALPTDIGRFIQEAQITGQLEHPNIVPVYDMGCGNDGQVFFTMKRVRGVSLAEIIFRIRHHDEEISRRYDLPALLRILLKVGDAISFAHDRGVIHRDLKPDNILVGRFGEVLVMDWGIAKVISKKDSETGRRLAEHRSITDRIDAATGRVKSSVAASGKPLTLSGMIAGTPAYMAPEQAKGGDTKLTEQVDIYALGAILYEILTLEAPYVGDNGLLIVRELLDRPPPPIRTRNPKRPVASELAAVVEKAMARDPNERYRAAEAFSADILNFLEQRPVSVYRDSMFSGLIKWVRRHPAIAVGLSSVLILLVVTSIFSVIAYDEARARKEALEQQIENDRRFGRERELLQKRLEIELLRRAVPPDPSRLDATGIDDAVARLNRILALDDDHIPSRIDRAVLMARLGRDADALRDLNHVVQLDEKHPLANFHRARLAERRGDMVGALECVRFARHVPTVGFSAHVLHLRLLAALGRFNEVQREIDQLVWQLPGRASVLAKLRVRFFEWERHARLGRPRLSRVLLDDEPLESADPLSRGFALLMAERFSEALAEFHVATDAGADAIAAWYGKACCLARLDHRSGAMIALDTAWTNGLNACEWPVLILDADLSALAEMPEFRALADSRPLQTRPNSGH